MRRTRAFCAFAVSVLSTTAFGSITAMAATQTQSQSLYNNQNQDINTQSGALVSQEQSSAMNSQQTETTQKQTANQKVDNTNQSQSEFTQDHSTSGSGSFNQTQSGSTSTNMNKTVSDTSAQITTTANTSTNQTGDIHAAGTSTLKQSSTSVILGTQTQTAQEQTVVQQNNHSSQQSNTSTNPIDYSYLLPSKSSFGQNEVVGYAVFDTHGNLLSDAYGIFPSSTNNAIKQFDPFAPSTPAAIIICAVNAYGQPVVNTQQTTLYLRSNNYNSRFLNPHTLEPIGSLVMPVGSTGIEIGYVNVGAATEFDVLDAGTTNPNARIAPQRPTVVATQQTQSAQVDNTVATQDQKTVIKSDAPQTSDTPITQETTLTQQANTSQSQSLDLQNNTQIQQNENATVNTQQDTSNHQASSPATDIQTTQNETVLSNNTVQASQQQSVTADGTVINVTFTQDHVTDVSGTTTLSQTIDVAEPSTTSTSWSTIVNVTLNGHQTQYGLNTTGPVTFNELQSVDTSKSSDVSDSIWIDYLVGSNHYTVTIR